MNINIKEKLENKIINKYTTFEDQNYLSAYNPKQRSMWHFAFVLVRSDPDKAVYDLNKDKDELNQQLDIFTSIAEETFSLEEWFNYLSKQ
ncbi:MAG: hypothetical protein K5923_00440 [Clostridia bacterium]|nr:hypothetical protein [Clostridia bacterium]